MLSSPSESLLARVTTQQREFVVGVIVALLALIALVIWRARGWEAPTSEPRAPTAVRSLVVLPLVGRETHLSYGIADELAAALSSVPGLRVAPAPPDFARDRRSPEDLRELASRLNVGALLYGRLDRTGGGRTFELAMLLQVPADDSILWSSVVTRDTNDLADLENEVAESVARVLRAQLALPARRVTAVQTRDREAHALVLVASSLRALRTKAATDSAVALLEDAVRRDSTFARAWSLLAGTTSDQGRALLAARRAIALDSALAEPYVVIARLHSARGDTSAALSELLVAIRRDPLLASARYDYSRLLAARGHLEEALREARRAHELDPLGQAIHQNYVQMLDRSGHDMEAKHEMAELRRMAKYLASQR